jgi:replicative DNA helicase
MSSRSEYLPEDSGSAPLYSTEVEMAVIGCVLDDPAYSLPLLQEQMPIGAEAFYDLRLARCYRVAGELSATGVQPDVPTLAAKLADKELGFGYWAKLLMDCQAIVPSARTLEVFIEVLTAYYIARRTRRLCSAASDAVSAESGGDLQRALELLGNLEREALAIRQSIETGRPSDDIASIVQQLQEDYDAARKQEIRSLPTGLADLDRITGGMRGQEMIVLAAPPSVGKTSLALTIACNMVFRNAIPTGIVSLETSRKKVLHRMACCEGRINGSPLLRGTFSDETLAAVAGVFRRFVGARDRIRICDRGALSGDALMSECRRMYRSGVRFFIVDYLQLLNCEAKTLREQVSMASKAVKAVAKELDCPVLCISSLNREAAKENRMPRMSDLRESGQIEFDADQIWFLFSEQPDENMQTVRLRVDKNKDGPTGEIELMFFRSQFRFANKQPDPPEV